MKIRSPWLKHGFWNTLEHGLTRVSDALTSIILLWVLPTEIFSKLALAQAVVAPLLFMFISPEVVIYRDFAQWKAAGPSLLASRLHAFRLFAWGKAQAAILIAWVVTSLFPGTESHYFRFSALLWAFSLSLSPQISGIDREFLRLDLKFEEVNVISLYQKLSLFLGTAVVALKFQGRVDLLASVAIFSLVSTALLARSRSRSALRQMGATEAALAGREGVSVLSTLSDSLRTFTVWTHCIGVIQNWVQTLDLFFLGLFRFPAREVGLYAVALKLANFSTALPLALSNLFSIWVGRRVPEDGFAREKKGVRQLSFWLATGSLLQMGVILLLAPWMISILSHGRWSRLEQTQLLVWLKWILSGTAIITSTYLLSSWLTLRKKIEGLFKQVYLPWLIISVATYGISARLGGFQAVARANVVVSIVYLFLLMVHSKRSL